MKINYERSGGFAGITKRSEIDTDKLPKGSANEIHDLVSKVDLKSVLKSGTKPSIPDSFQYRLSIEHGGTQSRADFNEQELRTNPDLAALVEKLGQVADQIA